MGFNFPASPALGATYTSGGVTYTWNGYGWVGGGIGDAPADGKTYGRKDALWSEASTKAYADTKVTKTGDTMSGFLTLHADPDAAMKASTKQYVDNKVAAIPTPDLSSKVSKTGDTMSGALTAPLFNTTTGYAAQFGGSASTGIYLDGTNLAIRPPGANSVYFQSAGGGQTYGYWNSAGLYVNNQLIVSGLETVNGGVTWNQQPASVYQGGPGGLLIYANGSAGYDAFISYWRPGGGYACNMGLMNDNRFGFGGWSVGGVQYRFWSREDFTEPPVHNTRLVYVGDYNYNSDTGIAEPYGRGAPMTSISGMNTSSGYYTITGRHAQLQVRRSDGYYNCEGA